MIDMKAIPCLLLVGFLTGVAPFSARAQACGPCDAPRIFAKVDVWLAEDDPLWETGLERQRVTEWLASNAHDFFGEPCTEIMVEADIRRALEDVATKLEAQRSAEADDLVDDLRDALSGQHYLLRLGFGRVGSTIVATGTLLRSHALSDGLAIYERTYAVRTPQRSEEPTTTVLQALNDLARDFGSLFEIIQRAETPVAVEITTAGVVDVGGTASIDFSSIRNADGDDVRRYLGGDLNLAIQLARPESRWQPTGGALDDRWHSVPGGRTTACRAPGSCESDDLHPLEEDIEIAPACWRGEPVRDGDPIATGTLRARCQLDVVVTPNSDDLELDEATMVSVFVYDHAGRLLPMDTRVTVQALALGSAEPTFGTVVGGAPGAPFLFTYQAGRQTGIDEVAVYAVNTDEWGSREKRDGATVSIGEKAWTFEMMETYDTRYASGEARWAGTFRVVDGERVEGGGVYRQVDEGRCFRQDRSGSFRIRGRLADGHFHLTADDYGELDGDVTLNEEDASCLVRGLIEAGSLAVELAKRLEANKNRQGPVRIPAADGGRGNYGGIIATVRSARGGR